MDQAGIAQAVMVQASTVYGHNASYVVEAVRAHPRRISGLFSRLSGSLAKRANAIPPTFQRRFGDFCSSEL
jgi:hypothetical protein